MAGRRAKKRITSNVKTVRKTVPVTIVKIKDVYKKDIEKHLKDKHKQSLSDKVVFQIMVQCLKDIPKKDFINKIPKKYLK